MLSWVETEGSRGDESVEARRALNSTVGCRLEVCRKGRQRGSKDSPGQIPRGVAWRLSRKEKQRRAAPGGVSQDDVSSVDPLSDGRLSGEESHQSDISHDVAQIETSLAMGKWLETSTRSCQVAQNRKPRSLLTCRAPAKKCWRRTCRETAPECPEQHRPEICIFVNGKEARLCSLEHKRDRNVWPCST